MKRSSPIKPCFGQWVTAGAGKDITVGEAAECGHNRMPFIYSSTTYNMQFPHQAPPEQAEQTAGSLMKTLNNSKGLGPFALGDHYVLTRQCALGDHGVLTRQCEYSTLE